MLASGSRVGNLRVGEGFRHCQIGAGKPVVPGHAIFIPEGPEKPKEKCARGNHIARGAPEELFRGRRFTGEAGDLQAADHHPRRGAAKDSEEAEILDVNKGEGGNADNGAEFAERKLPTERAKEGKKATVGEGQASRVHESSATPLAQRGDWVKIRRRLLGSLAGFFVLFGQRRQ